MIDHLEERTEAMKNIREEIEAGRKQGQNVSAALAAAGLYAALFMMLVR